jgi:Tfp pilus assembly protein PilF
MSSRKLLFPTLLSIALLFMAALPATAQNRAIGGKVTDEKGQPVADAQISIQGIDDDVNRSTKTNKKGEYLYLLGIQAVRFRVVVRKAGFEPQYQDNVKPELGETTKVDFQLKAGQDQKFPFEMSEAEKAQLKQQSAQGEKRKQLSAELKAHFDSGIQLMEQGKFADAEAEFQKILEKDPKQPGVLSRLADALAKQGKNEEALAIYEKAIVLSPANAELFGSMGVVLSKMGKAAESQEAFKKAASLDPAGAAQSFYNLGVSMFNSGHAEEAVASFKQAIAADPSFAEAYFQMGVCLSAKSETIPAALEAMKTYVKIGKKPDQVEVAKQLISSMGGK